MTHQAVKLASPKLTLFAFQLGYDLALGSETPVQDAEHLWQKCQEIGQRLGIAELVDLPAQIQPQNSTEITTYRELLRDRALSFYRRSFWTGLPLAGEVYPLQLHDTYAIDLTFRYPDRDLPLAKIEILNPQQCLDPKFINASIGQTLLFFATLTEAVEDMAELADRAMRQLNLGDLTRIGQNTLLGSPLFEYNNSTETCHLLIWLSNHPDTARLEAEGYYYQPLIKLLCYRHKISYVYRQSRFCDREARTYYSQLERQVMASASSPSDSQQQLIFFTERLKETSKIAFEYERFIRDLEIHQITLLTNCKNYDWRLQELQSCAKEGDDFESLAAFLARSQSQWLEQIAVDLAYLTPGKALFRQMVETIRGLVEIERAECDRALLEQEKDEQNRKEASENALQDTLQALGVGIAAGSIFASSVEALTQDWYLPNGQKISVPLAAPHPFLITIFGSAIVAVAAWKIARYTIQKWRSRSSIPSS